MSTSMLEVLLGVIEQQEADRRAECRLLRQLEDQARHEGNDVLADGYLLEQLEREQYPW